MIEAYHIFIKTDLMLDQLANDIRMLLDIGLSNSSKSISDQKRYGANYGGYYYLFEFRDIELNLVSNTGEMLEDDYADFNFYMIVYSQSIDKNDSYSVVGQLHSILKNAFKEAVLTKLE